MNFSKSLLTLALASLLFTSCKENAKENPVATETKTEKKIVAAVKPETATFNIEGMTCAVGCAKTIEEELTGLDGIQKASIDFDKKTATVEFDATLQTPEKIVETVEAVADGKTYKVSNLKSSGDKAMIFNQDQEKQKQKKEAKKECSSKTTSEKKSACCKTKKQCTADEKKASTM
jgi:copper chaperone CopZ